MKLLLILGSDDVLDLISRNIKPLGFDLIRYRYVIKAMDNIDEIDPTAIIISAQDFPRHWKILLQYVRAERSKDVCPIIILRGDNFSLEDASKAFFIGANGIVSENLVFAGEMHRLQNILSRYVNVEEKRKARRYEAETWTRFGLCVANPLNKIIIIGTVKTLSTTGISFAPYDQELIENIPPDEEVGECSLRVGDDIISPICRVVRKEPVLSMEFIFLSGNDQIILDNYLGSLSLAESKARNEKAAQKRRKMQAAFSMPIA
ncbi:MAG: PilZ domain-containing protein [Spirochaetaceae bacterium]|jgi:DNA-binding response OmpR family regulator|nr:PilZ domain-containing protein [Spirochaetaceae bacterium]